MKDPNKPRPSKKAVSKGLDGAAAGIESGETTPARTELHGSRSPSTNSAERSAASVASPPGGDGEKPRTVTLRLYIAGQTPKSLAALSNLRRLCEEHLSGKYAIELEVVDLIEKPQLALSDQILVIPTLVRKLPAPIKKIIGDLSNTERVLIGLNIHGDD